MLCVGMSDVQMITMNGEFASVDDNAEMMASFKGCKEFLLTNWVL